MPPSKRCIYKEGNRRCPFDGTGNPRLCDAHRVAVEAASRPRAPGEVLAGAFFDLLNGRPVDRDQTLGAIQDLAQQWSGTIGGNYRPDIQPGESEGSVHRRAQPGSSSGWWHGRGPQHGPQGPRSAEEAEAAARQKHLMAAREVFGFSPQEPLTFEKIKARHRQLLRNHPDKGGSTSRIINSTQPSSRMAIINSARDILEASLKPK